VQELLECGVIADVIIICQVFSSDSHSLHNLLALLYVHLVKELGTCLDVSLQPQQKEVMQSLQCIAGGNESVANHYESFLKWRIVSMPKVDQATCLRD